MFKIVLMMSAVVLSTSGQILIQPAVHYTQPHIAHPAVIANNAWEQQLPPNLLKSAKFYGNPRTAEHLAQESWLTDKESPVFSRKAEEIDRMQIHKIFHNAGLQQRK